jgi:hypothetical protein
MNTANHYSVTQKENLMFAFNRPLSLVIATIILAAIASTARASDIQPQNITIEKAAAIQGGIIMTAADAIPISRQMIADIGSISSGGQALVIDGIPAIIPIVKEGDRHIAIPIISA